MNTRHRTSITIAWMMISLSAQAGDSISQTKGIVFSKIANNGTVLADSATLGSAPGDWGCTRHNGSGLIFEVKVATPSSLRNAASTYSWLNNSAASNGGVAGTANGGTCTGSACDTQSYVAAVNASGLCGSSAWRLPTGRELQLVLGSAATGTGVPVADQNYFPNMSTGAYWTGTNFAANPQAAWAVAFDDGRAAWRGKDSSLRILVVR
ncbi:MAG: DUF1566 domain-containing protein [Ahniella sp.]|nr:DUF1566 domain-containing protein [Ahniella sp.]